MSPPRRNDKTASLLLLLLFLLSIYCIGRLLHFQGTSGFPCQERHYIQISGDTGRAGVFLFCRQPSLQEALGASRLHGVGTEGLDAGEAALISGTRLVVRKEGRRICLERGEMNGFFKMTIGIPLSINSESEVGLNAIPGIGPGLARAIVEERSRRGGFKSLEDLTMVRGIGNERLERIRPYLKL